MFSHFCLDEFNVWGLAHFSDECIVSHKCLECVFENTLLFEQPKTFKVEATLVVRSSRVLKVAEEVIILHNLRSKWISSIIFEGT